MGIFGQDWSSYQAAQPPLAGLDFAFVKVTEGLGYVSPVWARQRDHAKAGGLVWGAYHYPHMSNSPQAEAEFFLAQVAWQPGDVIVLDWEGYDPANSGIPAARQVEYKDAWLAYVKARMPDHRVGLYANTDYWLHVDTTGRCGDFLWIATSGAPPEAPGIRSPWMFHQYGTAGGVDHDFCPLPDRAALAAWARNAPQEADVQLSDQIRLGAWIPAHWPQDQGLADRQIPVDLALGSGYAHSRIAHENTDAIRVTLAQMQAAQAAQTAAIAKLASLVGTGVDTAAVVAAVQQAIKDATVHVAVDVTSPTATPATERTGQ